MIAGRVKSVVVRRLAKTLLLSFGLTTPGFAQATQVVFVQQPTPATAGAAITPSVTVQLRDSANDDVALLGVQVNMTLVTGTGTLSGITTRFTNSGGLATFNNLSIDLAGAKQLRASSGSLTPDTSVSFLISASTANNISLTSGNGQQDTVGRPLDSVFIVTVTDVFGNPVQGRSVTFSIIGFPAGATGQSLSVTNAMTDVDGRASSRLTLGSRVGTYTVTATATGLSGSPVTFTGTAVAGPASAISLTSGNNQTGVVATALDSLFVATVTDAFGNPVQGRAVTFSIFTIPSGATGQALSVTNATTDASGHASSRLTLGNRIGTYTVRATSTGLTGSPVTFTATATAGTASSIALTSGNNQTKPVSTLLDSQFVATVSDVFGNPVQGRSVTFSIYAFPSGATGQSLSVTNATSDVNGRVRTLLTLGSRIGTYTVRATSTGLSGSPVTFTATATAGAAASITLTSGNNQVDTVGTPLSQPFVVTVADNGGNPVAGVGVTFAIATFPTGAVGQTLSATNTPTDTLGQAKSTLTLGTLVGDYTVTASSPGLLGNPVTFTAAGEAGVPTRLAIGGSTTQVAGVSQNLTIAALDAFGNTATTYNGNKNLVFSGALPSTNPIVPPTVTRDNGTAIPFGTTTRIAFASGISTVLSGGRNGVMTLYRTSVDSIKVTEGSITSNGADALQVTVSPAPLSRFVVSLTSPQSNAEVFTGVNTVTAADSFGNTVVHQANLDPVAIETTLSGTITGLGSIGNNVLNQAGDFVAGVANLTGKMVFTGTAGMGTFAARSAGRTGVSGSVEVRNPVPTLTGATPNSGNRMQALTVTLIGTRFIPTVTAVSFGSGITVDSVKVSSSTTMDAFIEIQSSAALGPRNIVVTNPGPGGGTATLAGGFTVRNIPSLTGISPSTGVRGQSVSLTLKGTNFSAGATTVGIVGSGILLGDPSILNDSTLTVQATIDLGAADGPRQVFVSNSGTYGGTSNSLTFSVGSNPLPTLTSVTPDSGARLRVVDVKLRGTGFYPGLTSFSFGSGIAVQSSRVDSNTVISARIVIADSAATGPRNVTVTNIPPGGGTGTLTGGFRVLNPPPTVTNVNPQTVNRLQRAVLTVTGADFFAGPTTVSLGSGIRIDSVKVASHTELSAYITVDATALPGPRDLIVINLPPGGGRDTLQRAISVNNPSITLSDILPDSALVGSPALDLSLFGAGFVPESIVRLDTMALITKFISTDTLAATIPSAALDTAGVFDIAVESPGSGASNPLPFVVFHPVPTLVSVAPDSARRLDHIAISVTGTGFIRGYTTVTFSPPEYILVDSVRVTSPTALTAYVTVEGTAVLGDRTIAVSNPAPGGGLSSTRSFRVTGNPAPTLTSVQPTTISRLQTAAVVLTGTNFFKDASSVSFGTGIVVDSIRVDSLTSITAFVRVLVSAATGVRQVTVTNAPPGGGTSEARTIQVVNPQPQILSLTPPRGDRDTQLGLLVSGHNFIAGVTDLNMGTGILVNSIFIPNDSTLTATVTITATADTGSRNISVTNSPPGGGVDILVNGFTVGTIPAPTITSVSPGSGSRLETTTVSVVGTNFLGGVTQLDFGPGTSAAVTVDSSTHLSARVTVGAAAPVGTRTVYIENGSSTAGRDSLVDAFTVVNPVPVLRSLNPPNAPLLQTVDIQLLGKKFLAGVTRVSMGPGIDTNTVNVVNDSVIVANITLTASASPGPRNVTVTNIAPGGGTSAAVQFTVDPPSGGAPVLVAPVDSAAFFNTLVTLRWRASAGASEYELQVSTTPTFATFVHQEAGLTDTVRQVTLQSDTSYYWRVRASYSGSFGPFSGARFFRIGTPYPSTYALSASVTFPTYGQASEYSAGEYRLVGLPGGGNLMVRDVMAGTAGTDWQAYWDNGAPSTAAGLVPYDGGSNFVFSTGRAFWIIRRGDMIVSRSVPTAVLDTSGAVPVPLHTGWNLITNPYTDSIPWSAVRAANNLGQIEIVYGFEGAFTQAASLVPYKGYYYFNIGNRQALVFPFAASQSAGKLGVPDEDGWLVTVELTSGDQSDRALWLGVARDALNDLDPMDQRKPRAVGPITHLSFERPDWDPEYSTFASDIRAAVGDAQEWEFEVNVPARTASALRVEGLDRVPPELTVMLVDRGRGRTADLRASGGRYAFTPAAARSSFSIVIGNEDAVRRAVSDVTPGEFALGDNYPNPFNPTTTIPVSIPAASEVSLKIYNLLGEEVATLHTGPLAPGRHYFVWDGRNTRGMVLPTGLYLSRLTVAGGRAFTKKMLLMK